MSYRLKDLADSVRFEGEGDAITIENNLILNHASLALIDRLRSLGYRVILKPVGEFLKVDGGNKCPTLSSTSN